MKRRLKKLVFGIAGMVPRKIAEHAISAFEHGLGIGSGGGVDESGEKVVFDILRQAVESGPLTVFDVGANQGQYASEALARLGDRRDFVIHCFEPSSNTFRILSHNLGGEKRVRLHNFGLSDSAGRSLLYMDSEGSGLASLTQRKLDHYHIPHGRIREEVELRTLEDYCGAHRIDRIHLLKIDVEGHELDVLKGAAALLADGHIDFVQFEFGGCNIDTRTFYQDFHFLFRRTGFDLFRILPAGKLLALPDYRETDEKFTTTNFLAARGTFEIARKFRSHVV